MNQDFWVYVEAGSLWHRFAPQTPFGRAARDRLRPLVNRAELESRYDQVEACLRLLDALDADRVRLDRIQHHLKRLPRFPEATQGAFDEIEIFQLKKFLFNHGRLLGQLDEPLRRGFGLEAIPGDLDELLNRGRQGDESFHVADAYDPELAVTRAAIHANDAAAKANREALDQECQRRWAFAFQGRAFLLVPRDRLGDLVSASDLLDIEPWDAQQVCVRPRATAESLRLAEDRVALSAVERVLEARVLESISTRLRDAIPAFVTQSKAIEAFDLALAAARLAREAGLTRPILGDGAIEIIEGRHTPTETLCESLGTPYTPLSATFESGPTVLFGSNMGGKTVVLKTAGFLQVLAQMGLFVPARRFSTRVFTHFHYVGEGRSREEGRGLSGFGFEIRQFNEAHHDFAEDTLALFDEFGRTTNSSEAEALLSAIIEELTRQPQLTRQPLLARFEGTVALFSTHFQGVRRIAGARYFRMGGLDRSRLAFAPTEQADLESRIREIDRRMRFCLVPDSPNERSSDALAVARLLGLSPALVERAETFLHGEDRNEEDPCR